MQKVVLSDNDALIKLAALDLIDAALKALGVGSAKDVYMLPTFRRMIQKPQSIVPKAGRDGRSGTSGSRGRTAAVPIGRPG
jgi:hypothetical protein